MAEEKETMTEEEIDLKMSCHQKVVYTLNFFNSEEGQRLRAQLAENNGVKECVDMPKLESWVEEAKEFAKEYGRPLDLTSLGDFAPKPLGS